jgi:phenylacetate-CoA ligase
MYLINGQLTAELTLDAALERLKLQLPALLQAPPRNEEVLDCAEAFVHWLHSADPNPLLDEEQRQALIAFCARQPLSLKPERELGDDPRSLRRIDYCDGPFESWDSARCWKACWRVM